MASPSCERANVGLVFGACTSPIQSPQCSAVSAPSLLLLSVGSPPFVCPQPSPQPTTAPVFSPVCQPPVPFTSDATARVLPKPQRPPLPLCGPGWLVRIRGRGAACDGGCTACVCWRARTVQTSKRSAKRRSVIRGSLTPPAPSVSSPVTNPSSDSSMGTCLGRGTAGTVPWRVLSLIVAKILYCRFSNEHRQQNIHLLLAQGKASDKFCPPVFRGATPARSSGYCVMSQIKS